MAGDMAGDSPSRRLRMKTSGFSLFTRFFGGSMKNTNQSTASSCDSADFGELLDRAASSDQHPSTIASAIRPALPPKPHSKSIGSKLAATGTFTGSHSQLPKPSQPEPGRPSTLSASTSRPASSGYESGSSSGSWPRSTTPRPSHPLITISLSPHDNLSEYRNLFFTPPPQDPNITPSPTPPNSRLPKPDCVRGSPQATLDGEKGLLSSLQRHHSVTRSVQSSEKVNSPSIQSRMKLPSNTIRSGPPSMPLPRTPVPSAPPPELLLSPQQQTSNAELEVIRAQKPIARHTIGSVGTSPLPADQRTPNTTVTLSPSTDNPEGNFNINTASALQLRASLRLQDWQYEVLNTYMLKVTEAHVTEVMNLGNRVLALEKEVARKDKELKDLIINNGDSSQSQPHPTGVPTHSLLSPTSTLSGI